MVTPVNQILIKKLTTCGHRTLDFLLGKHKMPYDATFNFWQCATCGKDQYQTEFCRSTTNKSGLQRWCKQCDKTRMRQYRIQERLAALEAYGGKHPQCACPGCNEDRLPFLCIDHINGKGCKHRLEIGKGTNPGGGAFYRWLRKNNYPKGFRVLCHNCNTARQTGPCPVHETHNSQTNTTTQI